jgi:hypothetical protein
MIKFYWVSMIMSVATIVSYLLGYNDFGLFYLFLALGFGMLWFVQDLTNSEGS